MHGIATLLNVMPKQCHIAVFEPYTSSAEFGQRSMAIHRDHVGCHRLCINTGSKSSYLQWTRGFEEQPVRVNYSGPSFQVVGGIHSNFYDFGNVHHQSVNCDPKSSADSVAILKF